MIVYVAADLKNAIALQYSNYTSNKYLIQFEYPTDWMLHEKTNGSEEGSDLSVDKISFENAVFITINHYDSLTERFGSADLATAFYNTIKNAIRYDSSKEYSVIEFPSFVSIDNQNAGTFVFTQKDKYDVNSTPWAVQVWLVYVGDHGYLISFASQSNMFFTPENTEVREHFLNSINFLVT
jgi:hypothetical protein